MKDGRLPEVIRFGLLSSASDVSSFSFGTGVVYGDLKFASLALGLKVGIDESCLAPSDWLASDALGPLEDDGSLAWFVFCGMLLFPKVAGVKGSVGRPSSSMS